MGSRHTLHTTHITFNSHKRIRIQNCTPFSHVDAGPVPLDAFQAVGSTLKTDDLAEGEVVAETLYLSVDPCECLSCGGF